jgi:hypothetical protein
MPEDGIKTMGMESGMVDRAHRNDLAMERFTSKPLAAAPGHQQGFHPPLMQSNVKPEEL